MWNHSEPQNNSCRKLIVCRGQVHVPRKTKAQGLEKKFIYVGSWENKDR